MQPSDGKYEEFVRGLELIAVGLKRCSASLDRSAWYRAITPPKKPLRSFNGAYKVTEWGPGFFEASGEFVVTVKESSSAPPALAVECEFEAHFHGVLPIPKALVERFVSSEFQLILIPYARQFVSSVTAAMSIPPLILPLSTKSAVHSKSEASIEKTSKSQVKTKGR